MKYGKNATRQHQREESIVTHSSAGEITVVRSTRARRVTLAVTPTGKVRITIPSGVSVVEAMRFIDTKSEWIEKHRERIDKRILQPIEVPYYTRKHTVKAIPHQRPDIDIRINSKEFTVGYPDGMGIGDEPVQKAIKKAIEEAWRVEAKRYLPGRMRELSVVYGLPVNKITIRNTVSKWGSCSSRNDISLSLHLMRLPDHLIDFILTHELCHVVHKNHGQQFHELLNKLCGGREKEYNRELKNFHPRW